jgi:hypothetical protein
MADVSCADMLMEALLQSESIQFIRADGSYLGSYSAAEVARRLAPPSRDSAQVPRIAALEQVADAAYSAREVHSQFCKCQICERLNQALNALDAAPAPDEGGSLTDEQIVEIRDEHLPSQGEPFDCIAFARSIERALKRSQSGA